MKRFNAKEVLVPTVSLFLICAVVTLLLAVTNSITKPKIEEMQIEIENRTKAQVLSSADSFSDALTVARDGREYTYYEGFDKESRKAGYVFTCTSKGYGGDITVMVGVDNSGAVTGTEFLTISETAGLGMNAQKESFKQQFSGKTGEISVVKGSPSGNEIQALTGATITSRAVAAAVSEALGLFEEVSR